MNNITKLILKKCREAHKNGVKLITNNYGVFRNLDNDYFDFIRNEKRCCALGSLLYNTKATTPPHRMFITEEVKVRINKDDNYVYGFIRGFDAAEGVEEDEGFLDGKFVRETLIKEKILIPFTTTDQHDIIKL